MQGEGQTRAAGPFKAGQGHSRSIGVECWAEFEIPPPSLVCYNAIPAGIRIRCGVISSCESVKFALLGFVSVGVYGMGGWA